MAEETAFADATLTPVAPKPADFQFVRYREEGPVARVTLDRPQHNLLNERVLIELAAGIETLDANPAIKLLVLDAAGRTFCGGVDIGEYTPQRVFQMIDAFHRVFTAMVDAGKPVLVAVNGPAIGGGSELAAFGDMVVATPRARFALPEIRIGVFPPMASTILPYIIGPKRALEMVLTGEPISAEQALNLGLVNRLVPEASLAAVVAELEDKICSQSGAVLTMAKRAVLEGLGLSLREGLKQSMNLFLHELYRLEDSREGLRALVEKRKPQWKNR